MPASGLTKTCEPSRNICSTSLLSDSSPHARSVTSQASPPASRYAPPSLSDPPQSFFDPFNRIASTASRTALTLSVSAHVPQA